MSQSNHNRQGTILVAPAAFKGTLGAVEAARAMAAGARRGCPDCLVLERPVADGGEQTARILASALEGSLFAVDARDALDRPVVAEAAHLGDGVFAVDAASACGMARLDRRDFDPLRATSFGLGMQLRELLDRGASEVIVGVGGTAFVDGGVGALQALGAQFLDRRGRPIGSGGGSLVDLDRIHVGTLDARVGAVAWILLLDVRNPLLGSNGAAVVYGPQKGATVQDVERLEHGLENLVRIVESLTGRELADRPGMGAGGGLAVSLVGLLSAQSRPGASFVCECLGLSSLARRADLVLTGEGRLDGQSLWGKAPVEVARQVRPTPVVALVGSVGAQAPQGLFDRCVAVSPDGPPSSDRAARLLEQETAAVVESYFGEDAPLGGGATTIMDAWRG